MASLLQSLGISNDRPHRRLNPLTGEWVLVSPHRTRRPWLGQVEKVPQADFPAYDPDCYLCPNNLRAGNQRNPDYADTFVFDNDFPALLPPGQRPEAVSGRSDRAAAPELQGAPEQALGKDGPGSIADHAGQRIFRAESAYGLCRVVCFSPRHDLSLPLLEQPQIESVVRTWIEQDRDLSARDYLRYVQIFENKGDMMGASNPHPHSQIWGTNHIPNEPAKEYRALGNYAGQHQSCLICDLLDAERRSGERIVLENHHFTALVPFWAIWPFEILLIAHRHTPGLADLDSGEIASLAEMLRRLTTRFDNLFEVSFPYSMGFHQTPILSSRAGNGEPEQLAHLHAHYYPPLLRSATVRKFMVGYEMLATPQRDLTPEVAADRLRALSDVHYTRAGAVDQLHPG